MDRYTAANTRANNHPCDFAKSTVTARTQDQNLVATLSTISNETTRPTIASRKMRQWISTAEVQHKSAHECQAQGVERQLQRASSQQPCSRSGNGTNLGFTVQYVNLVWLCVLFVANVVGRATATKPCADRGASAIASAGAARGAGAMVLAAGATRSLHQARNFQPATKPIIKNKTATQLNNTKTKCQSVSPCKGTE